MVVIIMVVEGLHPIILSQSVNIAPRSFTSLLTVVCAHSVACLPAKLRDVIDANAYRVGLVEYILYACNIHNMLWAFKMGSSMGGSLV